MSVEAWVEVRTVVPQGWEELVAGVLNDAGCQGAREGSSAPHPAALPEGVSLVRSHFAARKDSKDLRDGLLAVTATLGEIDDELLGIHAGGEGFEFFDGAFLPGGKVGIHIVNELGKLGMIVDAGFDV